MKLEERLFRLSALGAHSNYGEEGFRQKDFRFVLELFINWMDVMMKPDIPKLHNTQIMRFLTQLQKDGLAKSKNKGGRQYYKLTRLGLLELIGSVTEIRGFARFPHTILVYYFLCTYRQRMLDLLQQEGSGFSKSFLLEIDTLFDHRRFLKQQIVEYELQIKRMRIRIEDTKGVASEAERLNRSKAPLREIVKEVSRLFPYELENQKPMAEALSDLRPELQYWEMTQGNLHRIDLLWSCQLAELEAQIKILSKIIERSQ